MDTTIGPLTSTPRSSRDLDEALHELRFASGLLLRALARCAAGCEAGHLRLLCSRLARTQAEQQSRLGTLLDRPRQPRSAPLAPKLWLSARAELPARDSEAIARLCQMAHDLGVRCEELLARGLPREVFEVIDPLAQVTRQLELQLAQHRRFD